MSGDGEVRAIRIDGSSTKVKASGSIPSICLGLMSPEVWDLVVGEYVSHATSFSSEARAALILPIASDTNFQIGTGPNIQAALTRVPPKLKKTAPAELTPWSKRFTPSVIR